MANNQPGPGQKWPRLRTARVLVICGMVLGSFCFQIKKGVEPILGSTPSHFLRLNLISRFAVIHRAEGLIVNELGDGGMVSAHRAGWIATNFEGVEVHLQGIIHQQAADERSTLAENQFYNFSGLDQANRAGQNTQHTRFVSRRCQVCWRW